MSVIRVNKNKDNPYVMIDKAAIQDKRLSWKAKGILSYLLSLPDDWQIYTTELTKHAPDGEAALRSGMKELEDAGYLIKEQVRTEAGTFGNINYTVIERPTAWRKSPNGSRPHSEKPDADEPDADNQRLLNNDNIKDNDKKENGVCEKPTDLELLHLFCEMTKLSMPNSPHEEMYWVREAGKWINDGATRADIINAISESDKRKTTLAKPSGITSYLKSAIARRKRGVSNNEADKSPPQSIEKTNEQIIKEMLDAEFGT